MVFDFIFYYVTMNTLYRLQECCKELKLKVAGEKKELIERLAPLGKFPELFTKKVEHKKKNTPLKPH